MKQEINIQALKDFLDKRLYEIQKIRVGKFRPVSTAKYVGKLEEISATLDFINHSLDEE